MSWKISWIKSEKKKAYFQESFILVRRWDTMNKINKKIHNMLKGNNYYGKIKMGKRIRNNEGEVIVCNLR